MKVSVSEATRDGLKARATRDGIHLAALLRGLLETGTKEK
jgi:hypothetical protein